MASKSSSVCIDANVLLDVILPNRPRYDFVSKYLKTEPGISISALSVHLAVHFGKKFSLAPDEVRSGLAELIIMPIDEQTVSWAFDKLQNSDFEDALQVACAVLNGCDTFVTFDKQLAKAYSPFIDMKIL